MLPVQRKSEPLRKCVHPVAGRSGVWILRPATRRSPLGPPFTPGSPLSRILTLCPLSIPAGIVDRNLLLAGNISGTATIRTFLTNNLTGSMTVRTSLDILHHTEQVTAVYIQPDLFRHTLIHVSGVVPGFAPVPLHFGHGSFNITSISFSHPNTASSNVILTVLRDACPFHRSLTAALLLLPPPPKKSPKISPKISLKSAPLKSNPPYPPAPPAPPSNAA